MGNPFKDGWAKFDPKGLTKMETEVAKMRDPIRKLTAKTAPDARWKALAKAAVVDIDRAAKSLDARKASAEALEKIEEPSFPSSLSKTLTLIVDTAKAEMKAVGKGGPFPKTQAAIDAAVAAHRAELKSQIPADREDCRVVWSGLKNEQRNDATFIEAHADTLQKFADQLVQDTAKIKAIDATKHQKAFAGLKKSASALITAMDSAARVLDKAVDDYDLMAAGIEESADNMQKPQFMADLVKDFAP